MAPNEPVVLITGATGKLGNVIAHQFAHTASSLVLVGTNIDRLHKLEESLNLPPKRVISLTAELTDPKAVRQLRDQVIAAYGRVDILLHFVGGWIGGKALNEVTAGEITEMLNQHLWTSFHLVQAFTPGMVKNGWGRFIVISSSVVAYPPAKDFPYTLGKTGQEVLFLTLAEELTFSGVTANVIRVNTIDSRYERDHARTAKNASWTTPEEIGAAVSYLCSEQAGVVNGARLPLYGSP